MIFSEYNLRDLLVIHYGKSLPAKNRLEGEFPVYGSSGITGYHNEYLVKGPGIIVGRKGSIGTVYFCEKDFFPIDTVYFIEVIKEKLDLGYAYYLLQQSGLSNLNTDAAVPGLNRDIFYSVKVEIPSIEAQRAIAKPIFLIDSIIKNNFEQIQNYEKLIETYYSKWFIKFKFPNHEQVKFVDGIPEGWLNTPLKQVMSTNPSTLKKGELDEILYVDISSVGQGKIESFTQYHIDDAPGRAKRKVQHGDVIWSCVRPNRKQYALIQNPQTNLIVSTGFTVLRSTKIPFTYLTALAASDDFCGYLTSVAQGAAYPAVTYKDFEDYELLLPPKSLLDKFHEVVEPMYEQIHILQTQNQKLHDLKETLLPRLMSGEIDVSKLSSIE